MLTLARLIIVVMLKLAYCNFSHANINMIIMIIVMLTLARLIIVVMLKLA